MINYNAALPPLPFMGKSSINVNNWMGEIKGRLTSLIRSMFSNGEQGFAYDFNDLDATKLNWRRNLFTETEFRNGVNDITVKGGSFAATTFEGLTQGTGIRIDTNASGTYVYKTFTHQVGIPYVFSCYVRTLDGSVPVLGDQSTDASADFVLVGKGSAIYTPYRSITHLGNGLYRAVAVITNGSTTTSFGVVKYAGNSTKPVIVSGYQLEVGSAVTPYQPFTDFNSEFIKAFPLHTLYQDTAGTIPVTATGQPVGLVKDKSGRNNHAFQTVSASRPILQQTPILGGELLVNGDGSDGVSSWITSISTLTNNAGVFSLTAAGQFGKVTNIVNLVVGKTYSLSIDVVSNTANAPVNVIARKQTAAENYGVIQITSAKQYSFLFTPTEASTRIIVEHGAATPTGSIVFDNVSVRELQGYSTDQNYLAFDGVDDFLQTNSIDFTATDKVSLFAGVRKLSDASAGMVCELGSNVSTAAGTFFIAAPPGASAQITAASNGTVARFADATNLPAPISTVIAASSDITANTLIIRANGTQRMKNTASQGGGNYANYPLYIGRRAGTSTPLNGHLYSLIGIGRLTSDSETLALEKAIAKATGVTLNV